MRDVFGQHRIDHLRFDRDHHGVEPRVAQIGTVGDEADAVRGLGETRIDDGEPIVPRGPATQ